MQWNPEVFYSTKKYKRLCFTHAVQEAIKNIEVSVEIDEIDDCSVRTTYCKKCDELNWPFEKEDF